MLSKRTLFLLVASILLQSFSFLSIKFSTLHEGLSLYVLLLMAFIFLGARSFVWQMLLKYNDLSKVYPFASLVQVVILIYSVLFFHEDVSVNNLVGLFLMLSGIYFIAGKE